MPAVEGVSALPASHPVPTPPLRGAASTEPIHGTDDDVTLFLWLVDQIERFEAVPDGDLAGPDDPARRRVRGLRRAAATLAARLDED